MVKQIDCPFGAVAKLQDPFEIAIGAGVHLDQIDEQLSRSTFPIPTLRILRRPDSIFDYEYEDFELVNYQFHPTIKAPVAV